MVRGAAFAVGLAGAIALPLSGALAQGSGCASGAEIASALDNYRVAWVASKGLLGEKDPSGSTKKVPDARGTPWERVTDEAHDGVDSLRSGPIGDNEHAELTTRIEGPATLRFWWKVDSQEYADFLSFVAAPENEAGAAETSPERLAAESNISGQREWAEVEFSLPEATGYRVRWSYRKDSSGHSGADAGWIDAIRVEGPGYGNIEWRSSEVEDGAVKLLWPTLSCRYYQVWWRPKGSSLAWQGMIPKVEPATGTEGSLLERASLYAERDYLITLEEPPSFTRTPPDREFAETEGDPLTLTYEAEGSGGIEYTWYFEDAGVDQPVPLSSAEDGREIVSDGRRSSLRFDGLTEENEGKYILVAENEAGREQAPPVSVAVFQPPRLEALVVRAGEKPEYRIAVEDTGEPTPLQELSVNEGQSLEIEPAFSGSGAIEVVWERADPETGPWRRMADRPDTRIRLDRATPADAGRYRVTLKSKWGDWDGPPVLDIRVNTHPKILCVRLGSDDCVVDGGEITTNQLEPFSLTVEVEGSKPLSYQWYRRDDPVLQHQGGTSPTVTIATEDAGTYEYQVHVTNKTTKFDVATLRVSIYPLADYTTFRDCDDCPAMVLIPEGSIKLDSTSLGKNADQLDHFLETKCDRVVIGTSVDCTSTGSGTFSGMYCKEKLDYSQNWQCPSFQHSFILAQFVNRRYGGRLFPDSLGRSDRWITSVFGTGFRMWTI